MSNDEPKTEKLGVGASQKISGMARPETQEQWEEVQRRYEELRQNEELYRVALSLTDHTVTVIDIPNQTLNQIYNEGDWTGVASSMPGAPESIIATGIIHPDDEEAYRDFYRRVYAGEPKAECTMRVAGEERGWVWFTMYCKTVFGEDGTPLKGITWSDDITARKRAEIMYEQYRTAVTYNATNSWEANLTLDTIISEDKEGAHHFHDAGLSTYTQLHDSAAANVPDSYVNAVREAFSRQALLDAFDSAAREVTRVYPFNPTDGTRQLWYRMTAYLTLNYSGDVMAILAAYDITEQHERDEQLKREAQLDPLCNVANRHTLELRVGSLLETLTSDVDGSIALLAFDVDDFKSINDSCGHLFGDRILIDFTNTLISCFRVEDLVGRSGGDEFMVCVKSLDASDAPKRAEAVHEALATTTYPEMDGKQVTSSIGIAIAHPGDSFEDLYRRADEALYRSKQAGKSRTTIIED